MGEQPGNTTNTGGGANIGGNVEAGGDVTGRDNFNIQAHTVYISTSNTQPASIAASSASDDGAPDARPANPFGLRGRIEDPALYFVRQPLTREVFDELRKGVSLSIVGESQTGKLSLLWHISQAGPAVLARAKEDFAYLDLQLIRSDDELFEELCGQLGVPTSRGIKLGRALKGRRAVVCLDEMEKMTWQGFTADLRSELRGLADGHAAPLTLVIASRTPLDRLFPDSELTTSPLAGLCTRISVPAFSLLEAQALVAQRLGQGGIALSPTAISEAWRASSGHPTQLEEALRQAFDQTAGA